MTITIISFDYNSVNMGLKKVYIKQMRANVHLSIVVLSNFNVMFGINEKWNERKYRRDFRLEIVNLRCSVEWNFRWRGKDGGRIT